MGRRILKSIEDYSSALKSAKERKFYYPFIDLMTQIAR